MCSREDKSTLEELFEKYFAKKKSTNVLEEKKMLVMACDIYILASEDKKEFKHGNDSSIRCGAYLRYDEQSSSYVGESIVGRFKVMVLEKQNIEHGNILQCGLGVNYMDKYYTVNCSEHTTTEETNAALIDGGVIIQTITC